MLTTPENPASRHGTALHRSAPFSRLRMAHASCDQRQRTPREIVERTRLTRQANLGFTIIELLVALAMIGILIALLLPAVQSARAAARRVQCQNNLRNIALAVTQFDVAHRRLPASGNYRVIDIAAGSTTQNHSWAVSILPWIEQTSLYERWDLDKPITDPVNRPLTQTHIPIFTCPDDISVIGKGDLSYVVNGGVGFTVRYTNGVEDCPVDPNGTVLDLNGDGAGCAGSPADDEDRKDFKQMGLFFLENWKNGITQRHHQLADVMDGLSQTFMVTDNVRAGYDPNNRAASFASPNPYRCAFYIGNPCATGSCTDGNVDYSRCNAGSARINSGLRSPEGRSAVPNSFHDGGVIMAYGDGHVSFLSESIDGAVYAALTSPQGMRLVDGPLQQVIVSD